MQITITSTRRRRRRRSCLAGLCALFAIYVAAWTPGWTQSTPTVPPTHVEARNASFHIDDRTVVRVSQLTGWLQATPGKSISLDDPRSFTLRIDGGETSIRSTDLTHLFNDQVLPTAITSVRNVQCSFQDGQLIVHGTAHRLVNISFESKSTVSADHEGHLMLHTTSLRGSGLLAAGLMHAMDITMSTMLKPGPHARFRVNGNDLDLPLGALFPPPVVDGHLTSARIVNDRLLLSFGPVNATAAPPKLSQAYIYFRGGTMRFGKMTMKDVDIELLDKNDAPEVDFSVAHYYHQLEAGFSKAMPNRGLLIYMGGVNAASVAAPH